MYIQERVCLTSDIEGWPPPLFETLPPCIHSTTKIDPSTFPFGGAAILSDRGRWRALLRPHVLILIRRDNHILSLLLHTNFYLAQKSEFNLNFILDFDQRFVQSFQHSDRVNEGFQTHVQACQHLARKNTRFLRFCPGLTLSRDRIQR